MNVINCFTCLWSREHLFSIRFRVIKGVIAYENRSTGFFWCEDCGAGIPPSRPFYRFMLE